TISLQYFVFPQPKTLQQYQSELMLACNRVPIEREDPNDDWLEVMPTPASTEASNEKIEDEREYITQRYFVDKMTL
ncbi:hypothetical protein ACJX0J_014574, partial [Zea mays]